MQTNGFRPEKAIEQSNRRDTSGLAYECGVCDARYYGSGAADGCCGGFEAVGRLLRAAEIGVDATRARELLREARQLEQLPEADDD